MADVTFTVDGKTLTAPAGTLLIDACKASGIERAAFSTTTPSWPRVQDYRR